LASIGQCCKYFVFNETSNKNKAQLHTTVKDLAVFTVIQTSLLQPVIWGWQTFGTDTNSGTYIYWLTFDDGFSLSVVYPAILFGGHLTNSVENRGQRERGSGGGRP